MKLICMISLFVSMTAFAHPGHPGPHPHGEGRNGGGVFGEIIDEAVEIDDSLGVVSLLDYVGGRDRGEDYDVDALPLPGRHCGFEKIYLNITNEAAKIKMVRVVYENGAPSEFRLEDEIKQVGEKSREFQLRENGQGLGDDDRCIDKVVVVGETLNPGRDNDWKDQAKVEVIGIK